MASDMKGWDVFRDPKWILDNLFRKYKVIWIPTIGWPTSNVGSGSLTGAPGRMYLGTGTTANSSALGISWIEDLLNSGDINQSYCDWTKRLEWEFIISRANSDAECVARVQLKESALEGALAQRGIGVEIDNYTLLGEAYGTSRGTVSLGTLTDRRAAYIKIVKTSTEVQFWVNRQLMGTLTGASVPNVKGTAGVAMIVSIKNGATGGVNALLYITKIFIVQEW